MNSKNKQVITTLKILDTMDIINLVDEYLPNDLEDLQCFLIPKQSSSKTIKIPKRSLRDLTNPLESYTNEGFKSRYSFSKETIHEIMNLISEDLKLSKNREKPSVPPFIELLLTIRFMITGTFQSMTDDLYGISQQTISKIITKISTLISELQDRFICFPTQTELVKITKNFYENTTFPCAIGCIGTTHIGIKNTDGNSTDTYLNEKDLSLKIQVHQLMLQDTARNLAYKKAIFNNKDSIKDKIVLDVGTGTGLLSIFCAQAGAAKVYAVEASGLHEIAKEVVKENKFENIIEVVHSKIEDFQLPNDLKVDVIVSEWMGFYLLHEGMLDSVIFARDTFLKPSGLIFPESATIYCAPCSVPSMYEFWKNIDGVSMECVGRRYRHIKSQKPEILQLNSKDLLTDGSAIFWIDLNDITTEELQTIYAQEIVVSLKNGNYEGICLWFTCQFPSSNDNEPIILSTSPSDEATHWKQTVIVLPSELTAEEGDPIAYEIFIRRSEDNVRRYNIELTMLDPDKITHPEPCACHMTKCIIIKKMLEQYETENALNS